MSKVDVKELACLYGMDGFIPDRPDWLEFLDCLKQYTRHVMEQAAKVCDHRIAMNPGDDVRNCEAEMIAQWIHEMKP